MTEAVALQSTDAFRLDIVGDGIAWLVFDLPGEKVNKLTSAALLELEKLLETVATVSSIQVLLLANGKESNGTFIAGADINEIEAITDANEAAEKVTQAHRLFERLSALPQKVIAVVDGKCLGGGTELILACDYRVASDDSRTAIGLPEVLLGIIPGFGGTQRLPRLIGIQPALKMILTGKPVDARRAHRLGLVDRVAPATLLRDAAIQFAREVVGAESSPVTRPRRRSLRERLLATELGRKVIRFFAERSIQKTTGGHYPAPAKALDAVLRGYSLPLSEGLAVESELVCELIAGPVSKNLISVFQSSEKLRRDIAAADSSSEGDAKPARRPTQPTRTGVLGAGVMGGGIAALLARKGFHVRLKDIAPESVTTAYREVWKSFQTLVRKRRMSRQEADNALCAISATTSTEDATGFKTVECVIEAIVEDIEVKQAVLRQVEPAMPDDAIFASNTSALSITKLAEVAQRPERVAGLHFFNPVHRMPLVEVVAGEKTSEETVTRLADLARKLGKYPLRVKDSPGFVVNRLLMPYLNEAAFLFEEGYRLLAVDKAVVEFGLPMGPFALIDEVGLDVALKVAKELHDKFGSRMAPAELLQQLTEAELLGKKGGAGFYRYRGGRRRGPNRELLSRFGGGGTLPDLPERWIQRLLLTMVNEASRCLDEQVVCEPWEIDIAMIMGTGFPPFHGGLLRWADSIGLDKVCRELDELANFTGGSGAERYRPHEGLKRRAEAKEGFYSLPAVG